MAKIIAELCSNWKNHSLADLVNAAALAGADAVKVQLFKAEHFPAGEQASKRELEFPRQWVQELAMLAHDNKMEAGASVFDLSATWQAVNQLDFLKLAAREQGNWDLTLNTLAYSKLSHKQVYRSIADESHLDLDTLGLEDKGITSLFTIPKYPTNLVEAMLGVIRAKSLFEREGLSWGWSSHTKSVWDCWFAVKLGASCIEKHLALSEDDVEAGHSLLPDNFAKMVRLCK